MRRRIKQRRQLSREAAARPPPPPQPQEKPLYCMSAEETRIAALALRPSAAEAQLADSAAASVIPHASTAVPTHATAAVPCSDERLPLSPEAEIADGSGPSPEVGPTPEQGRTLEAVSEALQAQMEQA